MREIFVNRRFAAETGAAAILGAALFAIGFATSPAMIRVFADAAGMHALVLMGPTDITAAGFDLGRALALPMLFGWIAIVIHRLRARRAPSTIALAIYGAVPLLATLAGVALSIQTVAALTGESVGGIEPMFAVRDLLPGFWTTRATMLAGVAMWVAAFVVGGRSRSSA